MIREFFKGITILILIVPLPISVIMHAMGLFKELDKHEAMAMYAFLLLMAVMGGGLLAEWNTDKKNEVEEVDQSEDKVVSKTP